MIDTLLGSPDKVIQLADRLSISQVVSNLGREDEPEAWTLVYMFSELEKSFRC